MNKDFNSWNKQKQQINNKESHPRYFIEREIWWCSLGVNIGSEQDGKNRYHERPVLILKKFNTDIAWILPLTTSSNNSRYYISLKLNNDRTSKIILSQLRLISTLRLRRRLGILDKYTFVNIQNRLCELIKTDYP